MNTPRLWRELDEGMGPADDIRALGRMLRGLLGDASTNASWTTGNYGDQTIADVGRARSKLGVSGSKYSVGAALFEALYPYVDAYGEQLNANQPSAVTSPTPTCKRLPLTKGMKGSDIQGAQRALWRALQGASTNARNGTYGDQTVADIALFRARYAVNQGDSNAKIGSDLWAVLTRWMDDKAVDLVHQQPPPPSPQRDSSDLRSLIVSECQWAYDHRGDFLYSQTRPMPSSLHVSGTKLTDCSGYATLSYKDAGAPNPNRTDGEFDGYGYTGTLAACGREVGTPKPGDLAMYGPRPDFSHVAVIDNAGGVFSFGSDPIKHYDTPWYRSDLACFIRSNHFDD